MRRRICALAFVALAAIIWRQPPAQAAGSIFSGLGYGVIQNFSSSRAVGMGGAGLALEDSTALNFSNPALLANLARAQLSMGGYFARQWMEDPTASDVEDWAQVEYFALGVPLGKGMALGFTLAPYSRVEFDYGWNDDLNGAPYFQSFQGTGGLSRTALQFAWAPGPWGMIGAAGTAVWGEIEELRGSYFQVSGYQDVERLNSQQWLAFGGALGIALRPAPDVTLGALWEPEVPIQLDQTITYTFEDSIVVAEDEFRLAAKYGLGASYRLSQSWLSAVQGIYSAWGGIAQVPGGSSLYQDSYEISAGMEWQPGSWDADRFTRRLEYRFGARYESGYVSSQGDPVRGWFGSLGISYPFSEGRSRLDLSLEAGRRGDLQNNGGEENLLTLRLGLNLGETWFQRSKPSWQGE